MWVQYDAMKQDIQGYAELSLQFGYMTMFITALPGACFAASLCAYWVAKYRIAQLLFTYQRPRPEGSDGIGVW